MKRILFSAVGALGALGTAGMIAMAAPASADTAPTCCKTATVTSGVPHAWLRRMPKSSGIPSETIDLEYNRDVLINGTNDHPGPRPENQLSATLSRETVKDFLNGPRAPKPAPKAQRVILRLKGTPG